MQVRLLPSELFSPVGNWKTILFQKEACCGFDSHSGYSIASAGHWRAQAAVTRPHNAVQVRLLLDAMTPMWVNIR